MILRINKYTRKVIVNYGTNSAFPDGNIPGIKCSDNEEIIRIHDNSELARKIFKENRKIRFTEDRKDIEIIETEEEEFQKKIESEKNSKRKELNEIEQKIFSNILDLFEKLLPEIQRFNVEISDEEKEMFIKRAGLKKYFSSE